MRDKHWYIALLRKMTYHDKQTIAGHVVTCGEDLTRKGTDKRAWFVAGEWRDMDAAAAWLVANQQYESVA
jgi:hypothetical protein